MKKTFLSIMLALLLLLACVGTSFALAREPLSFALPITVSGNRDDEPCDFVIEAMDGAPLPESVILSIHGNGHFNFREIKFTAPGLYHYKVYQKPGQNADCIYDESVFEICVTVANNEHYDGFTTEFSAYLEGEAAKSPGVEFRNTYVEVPTEPTPTTTKPGKPDTPHTGDEHNTAIWIVFAAAAFVGIVVVVALIAKRRKDEE